MEIIQELLKSADEKYADFQAKLTPNVDREFIIGVRVPDARKLCFVYGCHNSFVIIELIL